MNPLVKPAYIPRSPPISLPTPQVLSHLRQQRMLMVQTVAQYKFAHTALIHYLAQSRLI